MPLWEIANNIFAVAAILGGGILVVVLLVLLVSFLRSSFKPKRNNKADDYLLHSRAR